MDTSKFCHLTVDAVDKAYYVWHEENWIFSDTWHSHKMGQLIYVEKGFQYLDTARHKYLLPAHHCAWIPAGMPHKSTSSLPEVHLRCSFFQPAADVPDFYQHIRIFHTPGVLREMILYTARYSRSLLHDPIEDSFLTTIFASLPQLCEASLPLVLPVPQHKKLEAVVAYLSHHLDQDISIAKLAKAFAFSARTLERLFKDETGMSPATFLKLLRIIKAAELLSIPGESVSSVAYQVGYNSIPTFSSSFKKLIGKSPNEFLHQ